MYYYEAMAEAIKKTDTDDLYDNIACKLETLCGLSTIMGQNFDRSEPDRLELECNYHQMQAASQCLTDYIYEVKELFDELEKRAGERGKAC